MRYFYFYTFCNISLKNQRRQGMSNIRFRLSAVTYKINFIIQHAQKTYTPPYAYKVNT